MKTSAGILLYRVRGVYYEVFLVHHGGPFWKNKDAGAWSIPKGEFTGHEDPLTVAKREFKEETGFDIAGNFRALTPVKQKSGKLVYSWCVEGNIDEKAIHSNTATIQWPPKSGKTIEVPEIDRGEWFRPEQAKLKINAGQVALIDELLSVLGMP